MAEVKIGSRNKSKADTPQRILEEFANANPENWIDMDQLICLYKRQPFTETVKVPNIMQMTAAVEEFKTALALCTCLDCLNEPRRNKLLGIFAKYRVDVKHLCLTKNGRLSWLYPGYHTTLSMLYSALLQELQKPSFRIKACAHCGKIFFGRRSDAKYCSASCLNITKTNRYLKKKGGI